MSQKPVPVNCRYVCQRYAGFLLLVILWEGLQDRHVTYLPQHNLAEKETGEGAPDIF